MFTHVFLKVAWSGKSLIELFLLHDRDWCSLLFLPLDGTISVALHRCLFFTFAYHELREWSLITGKGGGATKRKGEGASEVLPIQKGGAEKVLAMMKGDT